MRPPEGYRPCVGLAVFNGDGKVFVGRRADKSLREHVAPAHEWQMPQGGVDPGEDLRAAALRELREETSITSVSVLDRTPDWLSYDLPRDIARQAWKSRWRGQAQIWFALRFEGTDDEIDVLAPAGGHKPEFDAWRWAELSETPGLIIPFKRPVYEAVAERFARYAAVTA